jgi:putative IMPACT (imprinted ancient) family translation regulator
MQAPVCPDCFAGTLRGDATPTGSEEVIHGLPTYVAHPDAGVTPIGTVVLLTDAFGWKLRNTRALADAYAKRVPCTVYVPDFMDGTHHTNPVSHSSVPHKHRNKVDDS